MHEQSEFEQDALLRHLSGRWETLCLGQHLISEKGRGLSFRVMTTHTSWMPWSGWWSAKCGMGVIIPVVSWSKLKRVSACLVVAPPSCWELGTMAYLNLMPWSNAAHWILLQGHISRAKLNWKSWGKKSFWLVWSQDLSAMVLCSLENLMKKWKKITLKKQRCNPCH